MMMLAAAGVSPSREPRSSSASNETRLAIDCRGRDATYPKTIGNESRFAIMSATGVVGQTSTVFHWDMPVA